MMVKQKRKVELVREEQSYEATCKQCQIALESEPAREERAKTLIILDVKCKLFGDGMVSH